MKMFGRFFTPLGLLFLIIIPLSSGYSQTAPDTPDRTALHRFFSTVGEDIWHVGTSPLRITTPQARNLLILGLFTTGMIYRGDESVSNHIGEDYAGLMPEGQLADPAEALAGPGRVYDQIGTAKVFLGLSAAMLSGGLIFQDHKLLNTTRLMAESFLLTSGIVSVSKRLFGRARPFVQSGPRHFDVFRFQNSTQEFRSFPSGHTASAFAMMTVIARQYPQWYVKYPAYALAVSVGIQRMTDRQHWPSDVLIGGAIGYWIGHTLATRRPHNSSSIAVAPLLGAQQVGIQLQF